MPLTNQQALEQNKRIIALPPNTRTAETALENRQKQQPIHQRVNLGQSIIRPNPISRFAQKKVHKSALKVSRKTYQF